MGNTDRHAAAGGEGGEGGKGGGGGGINKGFSAKSASIKLKPEG